MARRAQIDAVRPVLTAIDKEVDGIENVLDAIESGADKATDVLESGLEKVADVVPEALDKGVHVTAEGTRRVARAFRNPRVVAIAVVGVSMAAGAGLGYLGYRLMKKRLELQYEERMEIQLDEMRKFYMRRAKTGPYSTPEAAADALGKYQGENEKVELPKDEPTKSYVDGQNHTRYDKVITSDEAKAEMTDRVVTLEETIERNVFVDGRPLVADDWDAEAEEANRNPEVPYVISHDEFMENSFEHPQTTLTYYEGDDVLADEKDGMVNEVESVVGIDNLARFGHGSRDSNIVYIRNERIESDFEVVRSTGRFSEEVMGLRHSDETPRRRKARWGDDE